MDRCHFSTYVSAVWSNHGFITEDAIAMKDNTRAFFAHGSILPSVIWSIFLVFLAAGF